MTRHKLSDPERFFSHVNFNGPVPENHPELGPCWIWMAGKTHGRGSFSIDGKTVLAHRYSYELTNGVTSEHLHHLCENPPCVNPGHTEPMSGEKHGSFHHPLQKCCKRGHEFTGENTYIDYRGYRYCKECRHLYYNSHKEEIAIYHKLYYLAH